jgi:CHAT domain-containing protein
LLPKLNERIAKRLFASVVASAVICTFVAPASAASKKSAAVEAVRLDERVNQLYREGKYPEALAVAQRLVAIAEVAYGSRSPSFAVTLNNLANIYQIMGRYSDAESVHKKNLAIIENVPSPDNLDIAQSLNNLANVYSSQGRYAEAAPLYERSIRLIETSPRGVDARSFALAINNLGENYFLQDRYTDAEPLYKKSLEIRERSLGSANTDVAQSLTNLGKLYSSLDRPSDAEPLFRRALAIYERALGPDHPEAARSLNGLAGVYLSQARYSEAEQLFRRALAIFEKTEGLGPNAAVAINNLAQIDIRQGRYTEAEPLYRKSLAIEEAAFGKDHPGVAHSLDNLAELYTVTGRYADAEPLYRRSLEIQEQAFGPDHSRATRSTYNLAQLYASQRRYGDALPLVTKMIDKGRVFSPIALPVLFGSEQNHLISAQDAVNYGLNVVQRDLDASEAVAAINKLAIRLSAGNDRLARLVRQDQDLKSEAEVLERTLITAVAKEPSKRDLLAEQRSKDRLAGIAGTRASLQKTFAKDFPDYAALSNPLPLTQAEIQSFLLDDEAIVLFSRSGGTKTFVFALTRGGVDWKEIPIAADTLVQKIGAFRRGLDLNALANAADLFSPSLASELYEVLFGPVDALIKDKKHLLVVPAGPLTALPFHLLVTEKPPVAIPDKLEAYRDAAWLIKRQAVTVLPSLASLKALRAFARKGQAPKPMVGFGDPVFDFNKAAPGDKRVVEAGPKRRNLDTGAYTSFWQGAGVDRSRLAQSLPQLPDTRDELNAVANKVGAAPGDIHLGADASETTVKRAPLADYGIVYFATHGLVAGDVKDLAEPSLALSIPKEPSALDDGLLTASEVAQLKLNADWVVLSACNTISGNKPGAEALSGLARSFFYAGARALLVTHWAVDSEAATRLTTSTFDRLRADPKIGRAEALRQAMLSYLNDTSAPQNAYPAFWGPFALIGEGAAR